MHFRHEWPGNINSSTEIVRSCVRYLCMAEETEQRWGWGWWSKCVAMSCFVFEIFIIHWKMIFHIFFRLRPSAEMKNAIDGDELDPHLKHKYRKNSIVWGNTRTWAPRWKLFDGCGFSANYFHLCIRCWKNEKCIKCCRYPINRGMNK